MSGSLKDASTWEYNNKEQIKALSDEKLREEWKSVSAYAKAFSDSGMAWTDELFFCFFSFAEEMNRRNFKTK